MKRLSPEKFMKFQAFVMGDYKRAAKCRKCDHGLAYGPGSTDDNCHKCAMERENRNK